MLRGKNVNLIAKKELVDTLRDKRTLFVSLILPLLLYPTLLLGLTQILGATRRNLQEERQKVWVDCEAGAADIMKLFTEQQLEPVHAQAEDEELLSLIRGASTGLDGDDADTARRRLQETLEKNGYAAALLCAPGFARSIDTFEQASATLLFDPTDEPSKTARRKINTALEGLFKQRRDALLKGAGQQEATRLRFMERPVAYAQKELATSSQKGAHSFAPMLGMLIVIMALTGAFYPAVDLVAGEKERGTMETLLVAPVTRTEIVLGKFKAVWVIAMTTAILNLTVMGLTFSKLAGMIGSGQIAFSIPPQAILAVMLILVPTSALFSALALALSSFATSYKEGQHYLSPLFLVVMPLSMVALLPNVQIGYALATVPVANVVLLVKAMLRGGEGVIGPALVATAATAVYAGIAIWVSVQIFKRESVLFRGGGGKGYDAKSIRAARAGLPTPGQGVLAFFIVLALIFYLSGRVTSTSSMVWAFLSAQVAVMLGTVLLARRYRVNVRETFSLRPFKPILVPAIMLAGACGVVVIMGLYAHVMPERQAQGLEKIIENLVQSSPLLIFVLMAILPPICEELLCRGWILSSMRTRYGAIAAVVISALLFALLHVDISRVPATFAAGLLLGFILVRTGSIFASILFHMTWNGVLIGMPLLSDTIGSKRLDTLLTGLLKPGPAVLAVAALGLAASVWILNRARPAASVAVEPTELTPNEKALHSPIGTDTRP